MAYLPQSRCCPPTDPIMADPRRVIRNFYHPQLVQVVHPVEIVNRHHCVPVFHHCYSYSERDEFVPTDVHSAYYRKGH
jgi:hypothetical protein